MNYDQGDVKPFKTINDADEEYRYMTTNGEVIFDFYKLNDKYLPSFAHTSGEYYMLYDDQNIPELLIVKLHSVSFINQTIRD